MLDEAVLKKKKPGSSRLNADRAVLRGGWVGLL